jgi:GNAT superfamily N-acetyltransferase
MNIDAKEVSIRSAKDDYIWNFKAIYKKIIVGYAKCTYRDNRLLLGDIFVYDKHPVPWSFLNCLLNHFGLSYRKDNFRSLGIGTRLLNCILSEATTAGLCEVWGSVTQQDIDRTPHLLSWYKRHGFIVSDADNECIEEAAKKITKKL